MSFGWHRWSLGSLLLLLGGSLGVLVEIHQDSINGTVGQSALLPVSYRFDGAPRFPLSFHWVFSNRVDKLVNCVVTNCSLGAGGAPSNCSARCFVHATHKGRVELFPENGSLVLRDLRLSDSGVYSVTFSLSRHGRHVTLTVHEQRVTPEHPADTGKHHTNYPVIGICSSTSLLLLILSCCCIKHQAQQWKRRIVKQQQVSSVQESQMESTMGRDMATIYAQIGDSFEQSLP